MLEFLPPIKHAVSSIRRQVIRRAHFTSKNRQTPSKDGPRSPQRCLPESADQSFDRIHPGPSLLRSHKPYLIVFEQKRADNISSIAPNTTRDDAKLGIKMRNWVQFVSTPTADTPGTALVLHFDNKRYLFGDIGEGTQRVCVQRKIGLRNVEDLFLTGPVGWGNAGGLLGMILTLADQTKAARAESERVRKEKLQRKGELAEGEEVEKEFLNIHGGKNLTHLLCTSRRFVFRQGMPVNTHEIRTGTERSSQSWAPTWSDPNIKVWAMAIEPEVAPMSPRKRTHDEISDQSPQVGSSKMESREDEEDREDQLRKSVLSSMFNSNWRLDTLVTKKLSQVKLPAAIFIRNSEGKIEKYTGSIYDNNTMSTPDVDVLVRNPWPGAMIESLPPTTPSRSSVSYIVKNYPQRGKFNPKEAIKRGVTPGKDFGILTNGGSVQAKDGSMVTPDMVMGETKEGSGFAVVELPDTSYIVAMTGREEWSSKEVMSGVKAIIWILGPGVLGDPRFENFIRDHQEWKHIVSSKDCCANNLALESPASAAIRLHLLDSQRFPVPIYNNEVDSAVEDGKAVGYEKARAGKTFLLEPRFEFQDEAIVPFLNTAQVVEEASTEVAELAEVARKKINSPEYLSKLDQLQSDIPCKDAEVITLGTGSALPSKYRNVSATLLRVPGFGSYLFDCGENTLGQLKRVFGDELQEVLRDLKAIWISHLHADHHLGTNSVIRAWKEATKDDTKKSKLVVASDVAMLDWLEEYSQVEDFGYDRIEPVILGRSQSNYTHQFTNERIKEYGIASIRACAVSHCAGALAVVFDFPNGFKVAYSGDCRPSPQFAQLGKGATLLIHEATFDDELKGDALAKKHSTTSEALDIGRQMDARRIVLTHFSQRYQKIPVMITEGGKDQVAIVAFDYMRVKVGDIAKVEAFRPALLKLYEEKEQEKEGDKDE